MKRNCEQQDRLSGAVKKFPAIAVSARHSNVLENELLSTQSTIDSNNSQLLKMSHVDPSCHARRTTQFDDIDSRESNNILLSSEYVQGMYDYFSETEQEFAIDGDYMTHQIEVRPHHRSHCVGIMVDVHHRLHLVPETLSRAVNLLDRYLSVTIIPLSELKIAALASLMLAMKYEENKHLNVIALLTTAQYNNSAAAKSELIEMSVVWCMEQELDVLCSVRGFVGPPTVFTFLCRCVRAAHAGKTMVHIACYLADRCLLEYELLQFAPSLLAAACVSIARKSCNYQPWSITLTHYTKYKFDDIQKCIDVVSRLLEITNSKLTNSNNSNRGPDAGQAENGCTGTNTTPQQTVSTHYLDYTTPPTTNRTTAHSMTTSSQAAAESKHKNKPTLTSGLSSRDPLPNTSLPNIPKLNLQDYNKSTNVAQNTRHGLKKIKRDSHYYLNSVERKYASSDYGNVATTVQLKFA